MERKLSRDLQNDILLALSVGLKQDAQIATVAKHVLTAFKVPTTAEIVAHLSAGREEQAMIGIADLLSPDVAIFLLMETNSEQAQPAGARIRAALDYLQGVRCPGFSPVPREFKQVV